MPINAIFESRPNRPGPGRRRRRPMLRPVVEAMEERLLLNAASVAARAVVSAPAAQMTLLGTAGTSVKEFTGLHDKLATLAAQMGALPAGTARQPIVGEVTGLVKTFTKHETARYKKAQALARKAPHTGGVANAASIEQMTHQQVLAQNQREVAWFGWASYTTFQAPLSVRAASAPAQDAGRVGTKAQSPPITQGEADLALLSLSTTLAEIQSDVTKPVPSDPCSAYQAFEDRNELRGLSFFLTVVGVTLFEKASPDAVALFKAQARQTYDATGRAASEAERASRAAATSTTVPAAAVHRGVKATPPPIGPAPPNPIS